jgi:hemerythrin
MAVQWRAEFETGFPELDRQHRSIFDSLGRLEKLLREHRASGPEAAEIARKLFADTDAHFACEETCMIRVACPAAEANRRAHAVFRESVAGFQREIGESGPTEALVRELVELVEGWFIAHICHTDIHLRACAKRSRRR